MTPPKGAEQIKPGIEPGERKPSACTVFPVFAIKITKKTATVNK